MNKILFVLFMIEALCGSPLQRKINEILDRRFGK